MFIKLSNIVINTDRISTIDLNRIGVSGREGRYVTVRFSDSDEDKAFILPEAANYLLMLLDVNTAFAENADAGQPSTATSDYPLIYGGQSLASGIAQLLRDEFTQGASIDQIEDALQLNVNDHATSLALQALIKERVVIVTDRREDPSILYHHASHRPDRPTPEKEADLVSDPLIPFHSALRDGELQCCECKHQSCATCLTAQACCQCNCLAFTKLEAPLDSPSRDVLVTEHQTNRKNWITALAGTLNFLKHQEGVSHQGYFYSGWAGRELQELLRWLSKNLNSIPDLSAQADPPPATKERPCAYFGGRVEGWRVPERVYTTNLPLAPITPILGYGFTCPECHEQLGLPFSPNWFNKPGETFSYSCSCNTDLQVTIPSSILDLLAQALESASRLEANIERLIDPTTDERS